jgi:phage tail sheath protein FI
MAEYLHPGVYIEETSYRGKPIQGVSTSTAGFVGAARKGPSARAEFVPSFAAFQRTFGAPLQPSGGLGDYLGHAVRSFFDNGGARCYVVRVLAADALASAATLEQGTVIRLAPGVTVRGPTRTLRLNSLRGVGQGSTLRVFTRPNAGAAFAETRAATVASYDAVRGTVTVNAADEIPAGVALEPNNTVILINGVAPNGVAPLGGGATFTARNRGVDGDRVAVELRPRDRPPVALTSVGARRQDPQIDVDSTTFPLGAGQTTLRFTVPSLRRLRVGDQIRVGASTGLTVQGIAAGDVTFGVVGGGAGANHTAGGTMSLISRGGVTLGTSFPLGAMLPAFAIDMTGALPAGPSALPHDVAALLRANDVLRLDTAGTTTDVTITAARVAEEIAPGAHVTLAAGGLAGPEVAPTEARITGATDANPDYARFFVGDASVFAAPARAGSPEKVAISDGGNVDQGSVLLVDPAENTLYVAKAAGAFPTNVALADWQTLEVLQVAADGQTTVRVAATASFYSGAVVELDTGTNKIEAVVQSVDPGARTVTFTAGLALGAGNFVDLPADPAARAVYLRTCEVDVVVSEDGVVRESFPGLTWNPDPATDAGLRYFATRITDPESGSKLVTVTAAAGALTFAGAPVSADGQPRWLANGSNGSALTEIDLIGTDNGPGQRTGIQALAERDDISIVAVPGVTAETVQGQLITHCERLKYRIAVLDAPQNALDVTALQSHRNNYDSKYAAYYAPWLRALNLETGRTESFPPSGHVIGIYARSDNTVGVHKAPANEVVRNIADVVLPFTAAEQDVLNPIGVNLIRDLTPRGIRVWGARTISSDQEWKYVNIRRLFIYLEHSIDLGTQWVVFEPNSESLWARVVETITSFLLGVWKSGALMGTTPDEAFFVRCDRTTMTQDDIDNGRLVCEIGVAPVAPAEFVIFRIGQFTANKSA